MSERLTYRIDEVAEMFGVSRGTIYNWHKRGDLRFVKVGSVTLVPASELDRLVTRDDQVTAIEWLRTDQS